MGFVSTLLYAICLRFIGHSDDPLLRSDIGNLQFSRALIHRVAAPAVSFALLAGQFGDPTFAFSVSYRFWADHPDAFFKHECLKSGVMRWYVIRSDAVF